MVSLSKVGLVSDVEIYDRETGSEVLKGLVERTGTGHVIVRVDLRDEPDLAMKGFAIGDISVSEERDHAV